MFTPRHRILTAEWLDRPDVSIEDLRPSMAFIRRINRYIGGQRALLGHFQRWAVDWPSGKTMHILDLGTGTGDLPLALARWAKQEGHQLRITAVDINPAVLKLAGEHLQTAGDLADGIQLLRGDALHLPFAPNSFDYVITSMFLHHLSDIEVLTVLRVMDKLARRGIIWNDLMRDRRAYWWVKLMTLGADAMVKHDGPASIMAGFGRQEVMDMRQRLDLSYTQYRTHFGYRFTLAGQR